MQRMIRTSKAAAAAAVLLVSLSVAGAGQAVPGSGFQRLATVNATTAPAVAMVRTGDGTLHLVYQTFSGRSLSGLGTLAISAAGKPGAEVQALAGWQAGQPGLVAVNGGIEAIFGAISPGLVSSVWGITSTNGGTSWSAPVDVKGGGPNEALAYGADVTAAMAGSGPVVTLPQAGNLVVQTGLGAGSPSSVVTNASNGAVGGTGVAVDAASGTVVASWASIAHDPTLYMQSVAPIGAAQAVPGQARNALVLSGRDSGAGVFGAYTADGTHVRLLRYGGGSVAVGSRSGTTAKVLGTATGIDGRIWVMWGDDSVGGGIALTRSNKAVTRFEPIQHVDPNAGSLYRISGDGKLGPLDLLVDEIPNGKGPVQPAGLYYARVLPVLSVTTAVSPVKNKKGVVVAHKLTVTVTDAGDPVAGASVAVKSQKQTTNAQGVASFVLPGASAALTVTKPGYHVLSQTVHL
jgi:hypothetical protein